MTRDIPDGWKVEKLGEAFIVKDGTHDSPKYVIDDTSYPLLTSKNIKEGKLFLDDCNYISQNDFDKINQRSKVHKNDIIMPMIGTIGNPLFLVEEPNFAIKNVALFKPKDENPKFLLHYLKSNFIKQKFKIDAKGGTQKFVSLTYLRNLQIPIPPLPQQDKIVKVLDISSALIEEQKELIEKYDLFLKSKFIEMFGDPIGNPMGWKVEKLERFTTLVSSGSTPKGGQSSYLTEGEIKFIRSQNVRMNKMKYDGIYYISEEVYTKMKRTQVKYNDVLLNITGASIGRTAIYKDTARANVNQHVCIIRLNKQLNNVYLNYFISADSFQHKIIANQSGATREALNFTQIKQFNISYPPMELQNKFASIVEQTKTIKEQEVQKLEHLETLHNSLMDKAFKGEIE